MENIITFKKAVLSAANIVITKDYSIKPTELIITMMEELINDPSKRIYKIIVRDVPTQNYATLGIYKEDNSLIIVGNGATLSSWSYNEVISDVVELHTELNYLIEEPKYSPIRYYKSKEVITSRVRVEFTIDEIQTLQALATDVEDSALKTIILDMTTKILNNELKEEDVESLLNKFK